MTDEFLLTLVVAVYADVFSSTLLTLQVSATLRHIPPVAHVAEELRQTIRSTNVAAIAADSPNALITLFDCCCTRFVIDSL